MLPLTRVKFAVLEDGYTKKSVLLAAETYKESFRHRIDDYIDLMPDIQVGQVLCLQYTEEKVKHSITLVDKSAKDIDAHYSYLPNQYVVLVSMADNVDYVKAYALAKRKALECTGHNLSQLDFVTSVRCWTSIHPSIKQPTVPRKTRRK